MAIHPLTAEAFHSKAQCECNSVIIRIHCVGSLTACTNCMPVHLVNAELSDLISESRGKAKGSAESFGFILWGL